MPQMLNDLELTVGNSTTIDNMTIGFDGISEDSRCPIGTTCVRAGQVVASLRASSDAGGGKPTVRFSLALTPLEPDQATADQATKVVLGRRVTLLEVMPHPVQGVTLDPKRYTITLRVERADPK